MFFQKSQNAKKIILFPNPVGRTASKSPPLKSCFKAKFCSCCNLTFSLVDFVFPIQIMTILRRVFSFKVGHFQARTQSF